MICPLCYKEALKKCCCTIPTYMCINNHSWYICIKCNYITKYVIKVHINVCEKCIYKIYK